jgi:pSer/pThr/pTyr-binding forkhead associated (FHA) protein
MDETNNFYYQDGGSRNGTVINGTKIRSREARMLDPGDTLAFGSVNALLCPPETLWDAFHL